MPEKAEKSTAQILRIIEHYVLTLRRRNPTATESRFAYSLARMLAGWAAGSGELDVSNKGQ